MFTINDVRNLGNAMLNQCDVDDPVSTIAGTTEEKPAHQTLKVKIKKLAPVDVPIITVEPVAEEPIVEEPVVEEPTPTVQVVVPAPKKHLKRAVIPEGQKVMAGVPMTAADLGIDISNII